MLLQNECYIQNHPPVEATSVRHQHETNVSLCIVWLCLLLPSPTVTHSLSLSLRLMLLTITVPRCSALLSCTFTCQPVIPPDSLTFSQPACCWICSVDLTTRVAPLHPLPCFSALHSRAPTVPSSGTHPCGPFSLRSALARNGDRCQRCMRLERANLCDLDRVRYCRGQRSSSGRAVTGERCFSKSDCCRGN